MNTFFLIDETFFPELHSGLIWIQTVFANVNGESEKVRETGTCTHFRENQSASTDRQGERERCSLMNFVIFFKLLELVYVFQSFVYIFAKNSDRRDVLEHVE